jgi:hypothetical protein
MSDSVKNRKLAHNGWLIMMLSIPLMCCMAITKWFALPTLIFAIIGGIMFIVGISREADKQIKKALEDFHNSIKDKTE